MHSLQKVHRTGTGRGPRAPTGTDSEDSFFTGAGHVYPHLDEAHGRWLQQQQWRRLRPRDRDRPPTSMCAPVCGYHNVIPPLGELTRTFPSLYIGECHGIARALWNIKASFTDYSIWLKGNVIGMSGPCNHGSQKKTGTMQSLQEESEGR